MPINNLMEDAATAEISRAQIWQWIKHPAGKLDDGRKVTVELFRERRARGAGQARRQPSASKPTRAGNYERAAALIDSITTAPDFGTFITLPAYQEIN